MLGPMPGLAGGRFQAVPVRVWYWLSPIMSARWP